MRDTGIGGQGSGVRDWGSGIRERGIKDETGLQRPDP
jgi:hypothetical protein